MKKTELDRNEDGRVDKIIIYNDNSFDEIQILDNNFNGMAEIRVYYIINFDDDKVMVYVEIDNNNDGIFDSFKRYEYRITQE